MKARTTIGSLTLACALVAIPASAAEEGTVRSGEAERVTVTATRLPAEPADLRTVPAPVRVYTREQIEASGALTLQEFFQRQGTLHVFNQVGNPAQSSVALRGFGDDTTTALIVDGVRFNEPDDNRSSFDLIPLHDVERIEVLPGSYSSAYGGGAIAGVVNVVTRSGGDDPPFEALAVAGSWGTGQLFAGSGGTHGAVSYYASASLTTSDGWRESTGGSMISALGQVDWKLAAGQWLRFSLRANDDDINHAGSLTAAEIEEDPRQNVFNEPDFSDQRLGLATLEYRAAPGKAFDVRANLSYRTNDVQILTTGRTAAAFGSGFLTDTTYDTAALTAQAGWNAARGRVRSSLRFGGELRSSDFRSDGFFTTPEGEDPSLTTENRTDETITGAFLDETLEIGGHWSVEAGVRHDSTSLDYRQDDEFSGASGGDRRFSQWSPRLGVTFLPAERTRIYASASRAFQAPTVNQLFAFVGFGSNPLLQPQTSTTFELGLSQTYGRGSQLSFDLYRTDVEDEIFFVFKDPDTFLGENENVGDTRRRGFELQLSGLIGNRVHGTLGYVYTDATFTRGVDRNGDGALTPGPDPITFTSDILPGDRLPMVPEHKVTASVAWDVTRRWTLGLYGFWVSEQPLTGDEANEAAPLASYPVLGLDLRYRTAHWEAFLLVQNLLDEDYATWGITNGAAEYFQPAAPRALAAGLRFRI